MAHTVRTGGDPLQDKLDARNALTVGRVLDLYMASAHYATKAASTQATGRGQIERHLRPLIGKRYVDRADARRHQAGLRGNPRRRDGGDRQDRLSWPRPRPWRRGRRALCLPPVAGRFQWAVTERLIERDPTSGVDFGRDGERNTVLDEDGYARLFSTLATMESERRLRPAVADAIRIIAMTGARRGEITGLRWRHVERAGASSWQRHKTARTTGKPRVIALPSSGARNHRRQPAGAPDGFVFCASKGEGPLSLAKPWRAIRAEAGLPEAIGLHGLRHSLAIPLAVGGAQAPEIMTDAWPPAAEHRRRKYLHLQQRRPQLPWPSAPPRLHWPAWPRPPALRLPLLLRSRRANNG